MVRWFVGRPLGIFNTLYYISTYNLILGYLWNYILCSVYVDMVNNKNNVNDNFFLTKTTKIYIFSVQVRTINFQQG